ncbi:helix-turn-helix transcriptional regulator [Gracilibacillus alcaliphilus]|uniref:helix-turn-helix transcriptional regulator n=1 Tax=Gracilibacillus alcaliphilus TaxID=1401441 RepID=UPI00195E8259|nr:metalloregulator ArsR/SmtB family transcription factor [Gracilibacillus alcaliphilus]MBM7677756.1 putative ArsR family transcriptional regulator [Gracilibacillus alcaliphilus]
MQHHLPTTKDKILELLKKEVTLSVNELIDHLQITHMAIRKHLATLEKDGLIRSEAEKVSVGRPRQKYRLTAKGDRLFPNNYESISVEFLKDIEDLHGEEAIKQLFHKREERQVHAYKKLVTSPSANEKIRKMVDIQNNKGYMAELVEHEDNHFEIIEYNCPIFAVASTYHTACQCETSMFKQVLDTQQVERVQCKTEGNNHCRFHVQF